MSLTQSTQGKSKAVSPLDTSWDLAYKLAFGGASGQLGTGELGLSSNKKRLTHHTVETDAAEPKSS